MACRKQARDADIAEAAEDWPKCRGDVRQRRVNLFAGLPCSFWNAEAEGLEFLQIEAAMDVISPILQEVIHVLAAVMTCKLFYVCLPGV